MCTPYCLLNRRRRSLRRCCRANEFAHVVMHLRQHRFLRVHRMPIGSMNTRSLTSRSVYGLSTSVYGAAPVGFPSEGRAARLGLKAAMCNHTEDEPGPPLKMKVTGRVPASFSSVLVYEIETKLAAGCPEGSSKIVSATLAIYSTATPLNIPRCCVMNERSFARVGALSPVGGGAGA